MSSIVKAGGLKKKAATSMQFQKETYNSKTFQLAIEMVFLWLLTTSV